MSGSTIVILVAGAVVLLAALLPTVRRIFGWIVLLANSVASGWIFILMFLVTLDIIMRFAFGGPISGVTEIVEISIVAVLYLQITHALKVGRITRSDALYSTIMRRVPIVRSRAWRDLPRRRCGADVGDRHRWLAEMAAGL